MTSHKAPGSEPGRDAPQVRLPPTVASALVAGLEAVAQEAVSAITREVPAYSGAASGRMGANLRGGVQSGLGAFLQLVSGGADARAKLGQARQGAFELGAGEARTGRSLEALLAAYRVGARVSWRSWSQVAVDAGLAATEIAQLAEMVFAYIDELSAATAAGHAAEVGSVERLRERRLEDLGRLLAAGGTPEEELVEAAGRAEWTPATTLTAVLLPTASASALRGRLSPDTLVLGAPLPGFSSDLGLVLMLAADAHARGRARLLSVLEGRRAIVGPARPWAQAAESCRRVARLHALVVAGGLARSDPTDSEAHLAELVITADPQALEDLRAAVLAPMETVSGAVRGRLTETLAAWVLHQGRRDTVAEALYVHPQTVRYRMAQLRALYGDLLDDPAYLRQLTIALC